MLYLDPSLVKAILGPAFVVLAVGVVLALPMSLTTRPSHIAKVALVTTAGISLAALLCGQSLPREPANSGNAPVGATCADTTSGLGALQTLLAFGAIVTGSVAVAGALSAGARGYNRTAAGLLAISGCLLPYLGLVSWVVARMCDFS